MISTSKNYPLNVGECSIEYFDLFGNVTGAPNKVDPRANCPLPAALWAACQ